jgi:LysM repeat protein
MNKIGLIACLAAAAAFTGCLDPKYQSKRKRAAARQPEAPAQTYAPPRGEAWSVMQDDPRPQPAAAPVELESSAPAIDVTESEAVAATTGRPIAPVPVPATAVADSAAKPAAAGDETTTYIVQRGDTLLKIAKRYGLTMAAIKAANPNNQRLQKGDVLLGQKIKLPGRVEVGDQKVPEGAFAASAKPAQGAAKTYSGETVEYVVKVGDTAGAIALAHKTTVRAIAELNNIDPNRIRIGQKLRIPVGTAAAVAKSAPAPKPAAEKKVAAVPATAAKPAVPPPAKVEEPKAAAPAAVQPPVEEAAPPPPPPPADYFLYTVKDGEDITGISITYDLSPSEIRQLNNLPDNAELTAGMELKLPAGVQQ